MGWAAWKAPDWMLNYLVPVESLGVPLVLFHLGFVLACLVAGASAHTLVAVLLQRDRRLAAGLVCLTGGLLLAGLWGLTLDRYLVVGTEAQWRAGAAVPLPQSELALGFNLLGGLLALAFGGPAVALHRAGRALRVHG